MEKYLLGKINITNFKVGFLGVCLVVMVGGGGGGYASLKTVRILKIYLYGISGQIFGLFLPFSAIEGFELFWMGGLHKNIQLKLEFLKGSFLVQHFPTIH